MTNDEKLSAMQDRCAALEAKSLLCEVKMMLLEVKFLLTQSSATAQEKQLAQEITSEAEKIFNSVTAVKEVSEVHVIEEQPTKQEQVPVVDDTPDWVNDQPVTVEAPKQPLEAVKASTPSKSVANTHKASNSPTHDDIRMSCKKFHKLGFEKEVKAILAEYGATKAVDVSEDKISDCLEAILDLGKKAKKPQAVAAQAPKEDRPAVKEGEIGDNELRDALLAISRSGKKDGVKEIMAEYNYKKADDVPQHLRAELLAKARAL